MFRNDGMGASMARRSCVGRAELRSRNKLRIRVPVGTSTHFDDFVLGLRVGGEGMWGSGSRCALT